MFVCLFVCLCVARRDPGYGHRHRRRRGAHPTMRPTTERSVPAGNAAADELRHGHAMRCHHDRSLGVRQLESDEGRAHSQDDQAESDVAQACEYALIGWETLVRV